MSKITDVWDEVMRKRFKKEFIFPNYLPTALEIFDRITDENTEELKGNEETKSPLA